MSSLTPHLAPEDLLRIIDEPLADAMSSAHLESCAECRSRLEAFAEAAREYDRFHTSVLKPSLSPPPGQWRPLHFPPAPRARIRPAWWLLAAAIAAFAISVRLFVPAPSVRAAGLLRKAAAAERAAPRSHSRIHIRASSRVLDRDAHAQPGAETASGAALHALFDSAGYPWDDPLSAQAFSHWRASLAEAQDEVEEAGGVYVVRTVTRRGLLSGAALSLRGSDLHAFACTLRFRSGGEIIYITEIPAPPQAPEAAPAPIHSPQQRLVLRPTVPPTAGDEVNVIAALHSIGADLGEPIEIERNSAIIVVRVSGLDENRREQIGKALSGLSYAVLEFEPAGTNESKPAAAAKPTASDEKNNPLIGDLVKHPGGGVSLSDLRDQLIDDTDRAAQRAFALRGLARRFPPDVTPQLSPADTATLAGIVRDHAGGLTRSIEEVRRILGSIVPNLPSPGGSGAPNWQTAAERLPSVVDRLDRALNGATDASDARKLQIAQLLAELDRQIAALRLEAPQ
jgi:hypothetical protein